ncbi:MAG: DNA polymerase I, partial [Planctomycetota bacterium]
MKEERLFIIDGNNYVHRAYHALPPFKTSDGKPVGALFGFVRMILSIIKKENPDYLIVLFDTPKPTFRHKQFSEYKSNRPKASEELVFQIKNAKGVIDVLGIKTFSLEGYEADDIAASLAEKFKRQTKIYIVTSDKDVLQLIDDDVLVYDELKKRVIDREFFLKKYEIMPEQFIEWLSLTGDSSDNIPGARGIGPKTATQLIKKYKSVENMYIKLDEIQESLRKKLIESEKDVLMAKNLITLVKSIPLNFCLDDFRFTINSENIEKLARQWEFKSLGRDFGGQGEKHRDDDIEYIDYDKIDLKGRMVLRIIEYGNRNLPSNLSKTAGFIIADEKQAAFISLTSENIGWDEKAVNKLKRVLSDDKLEIVTDNAKKIHHFAVSNNIQVACGIADVSLMGYVIDSLPEQDVYSLSKKYLGIIYGDGLKATDEAKAAPVCLKLKDILVKEMEERDLLFLYEKIELPLSAVLAKMEYWGIKINSGILRKLSEELDVEIRSESEKIYEIAGSRFNINSPIELRHILFDKLNMPVTKKTKTGASVDAGVLSELSAMNPVCNNIIAYRNLSKLKSTYVDALPEMISKDGRIHTNFNSTGTVTGRLSSYNPNLQNIPSRGLRADNIRRAFIPEDGNVFISADYSQIDLRVLAEFSSDQKLIEAFKNDEDIHSFTASLVYKTDIE